MAAVEATAEQHRQAAAGELHGRWLRELACLASAGTKSPVWLLHYLDVSIPDPCTVLPVEADELPKDHCGRYIEQALRQDFEASATSLRALVTGSVFSRAVYTWASDLAPDNSSVPKEHKDEL